MITENKSYGKMPDGRAVSLFTLSNAKGMKVSITNYGGIITSILAPDRQGKMADVTLGFDAFEPYIKNPACFGALVGRFANRIENAEFELNGKSYKLYKNDGNNHLHGGKEGFQKKLWNAAIIPDKGQDKLELTYTSQDGEENYPGKLDAKVLYWLDEDGSLGLEYSAVSDKDTIINLTNHAYFNLAGHNAGVITDHILQLNADKFTVINNECIPDGEIRDVKGTPLDFTQFKKIGDGLKDEESCEQMKNGLGYDHNFVINSTGKGMQKAAEAYDPKSGRCMEVFTDKPGIQFYTGNFLDGSITGKGGAVYRRRNGFCLETQYFPNSVKHKHFPSPILRAGETYHFTTIYKFGVKQ